VGHRAGVVSMQVVVEVMRLMRHGPLPTVQGLADAYHVGARFFHHRSFSG
jgi:hypothetical protein